MTATRPFGSEPGAPWVGGRPPAADAVDQLCLELAEVCYSAVDPFEIAAALEVEAGLTNRAANRYGYPDVFALAEEIYRRTTCLPVEPGPQPDPWDVGVGAHVLHGAVYGLPLLCYAAITPMPREAGALTVVVASMLTSWMLGQGLAHLGYARLARSDPGGAARLLRAGLGAAAFVVLMVVIAVALSAPVPAPVLVFAVAQGIFLLGATVLLVLRAHRWLLVTLVPGVLAGASLLLGQPEPLAGLSWLPLVGSAVLAARFAVASTGNPAPGARGFRLGPELRAALPHALFGLVAAGLLVFPVMVIDPGQGPGLSVAALLILALSLSMGAAQWSRYRYRRQVQVLLRACHTPRPFARAARLLVLTALIRYAAVAALLIAATLAIALRAGATDPGWTALGTGVSSLALGAALFVAALLQKVRGGLITVLACGMALAFQIAPAVGSPSAWAGSAGSFSDVVAVQLLTSSVLLGGLLLGCWTVLGRVETHV
ncbi:MAG: hypothetical protein ACRDRH_16070 [Pseudonocardia sp.]